MDILEATRCMRLHELAHVLAPVPVIAPPASAQLRDAEATTAVGVNAIAAKSSRLPILLAEMVRTLTLFRPPPEVVS